MRTETVGTLIPTRDPSVAASSKNYRYSTDHQVVIDATRYSAASTSPSDWWRGRIPGVR